MRKFIDVGINLTDKMFQGIYNGKSKHPIDVKNILDRSHNLGIERIISLSGCLSDFNDNKILCELNENLYTTVGCHPTNCNECIDDLEGYMKMLTKCALYNNKVVAIGECGLDYDREQFCPRNVQLPCFEKQVQLAVELQLPLYLHCRSAHDDLIEILRRYYTNLPKDRLGVVHTFDGTLEQANILLSLGFYLGINGCSLKTEENLEVVKQLPLNRLLLETDAPWCEIRPTHAGYKYVKTFLTANKKEKWSGDCAVKGRNEPGNIVQVFEVLCGCRREDPDIVCDALLENSAKLFWPENK